MFRKKLVVEIDGQIHENQKDYDELRSDIINKLGITVIRFKNDEMKDLDKIKEKLAKYIN